MNVYRLLLRLAPRRLRDKHGAEMEAVFRAPPHRSAARGRMAAALAWLNAARDLIHAIPVEWFISGGGADASGRRAKGERSCSVRISDMRGGR